MYNYLIWLLSKKVCLSKILFWALIENFLPKSSRVECCQNNRVFTEYWSCYRYSGYSFPIVLKTLKPFQELKRILRVQLNC
jgi:hypothetical protein